MAEVRPGQHGEHIRDALLSAYLDDDVEDAETRRMIEHHLRDCDVCRARLDELRLVVGLLGNLPSPMPPRSFHLTPEMLERAPFPTPVRPAEPEAGAEVWYLRFQPALRWATAVAAVALVLLFGADLLAHQMGTGGSTAGNTTARGFTTSGSSSSASGAAESSASTVTSSSAGSSAQGSGAGVPPSAATPASNAGGVRPLARGAASTPAAGSAQGAGRTASPEAEPATSTANSSAPTAAATPTAQALAASHRGPMTPTSSAGGGSSGWTGWRLAELALALLVAWLLFVSVALPRLRRTRI